MRILRCWALATVLASVALAQAQAGKKLAGGHDSSRERLIGAWHLVRIDNPGPDGKSIPGPQPKGMLIYTRDGHMSVQLMYPKSAQPLSNEKSAIESGAARNHRSKPRKVNMEIKRVGSQPSAKGPAEYFTGAVRVDPLFQAPDPAFVSGASVTFEPGARTAWHTHPLGQTLIITAGAGWVQREAGPIEEVHPGDVVWFPPHEKHWHGAIPTTAMTHIAIQEKLDGKVVDWLEKVTDEQYRE